MRPPFANWKIGTAPPSTSYGRWQPCGTKEGVDVGTEGDEDEGLGVEEEVPMEESRLGEGLLAASSGVAAETGLGVSAESSAP
jgi:hypothetical protein